MLSQEEIDEKFLAGMKEVYEEIKLELSTLDHDQWQEVAWDKDRRSDFITTLVAMFDEVPDDCSGCMAEKLILIQEYGRTVSMMDGIQPANDKFADAWDLAIHRCSINKHNELVKWLKENGCDPVG